MAQTEATLSPRSEPAGQSDGKPHAWLIILNGALILLIGAMLVFVIPVFASMFLDFGMKVPGPTQFFIDWSKCVRTWWWWLLVNPLLIGFFVLFVSHFGKRISSRKWLWVSAAMLFLLLIWMSSSMLVGHVGLAPVTGGLKK